MLLPDRVREVGANDEAVEVGDHEEGRILRGSLPQQAAPRPLC